VQIDLSRLVKATQVSCLETSFKELVVVALHHCRFSELEETDITGHCMQTLGFFETGKLLKCSIAKPSFSLSVCVC
jgi:hypothetical protein